MTKIHWAMLCAATALFGCGSHTAMRATTPEQVATATPAMSQEDVTMTAANASVAMPEHTMAISLPDAPWTAERMTASAAPRALIGAWRRADNRAECAPLAPTSLGEGQGAHARSASYAGGWAVEFDKAGLPGIGANGETCAHCGRGAFGIAGTTMTPDSLESEEPPADRWADGSHADVQPTDEDPAQRGRVATLVVNGQGCVYQVWSFLGQEHLDELVAGLRFVDAQ